MPSPIARACVVTGDAVTHYRRAGRGAPVILISTVGLLASAVLASVPPGLSLIVPELDVAPGEIAAWLCLFLDALGLDRPVIIAAGWLAGAVQAFAAAEPDRVGRVLTLDAAGSSLAVASALHSIIDFRPADPPPVA